MKYIPDMAPELREPERRRFADYVVETALHCRDNQALLDVLRQELPADFQIELSGEGSTRRVYAFPLGVCLKLQRENYALDPLSDAELAERGGDEYLLKLGWRRRTANLCEMLFAANRPSLMPRIYGWMGSFGIVQRHPSVIVMETCRPLNLYIPNDGNGVKTADIGIDESGVLWLFDRRLTDQPRPDHLLPYECLGETDEDTIWLGNIGVSPETGKFVFLDRSDHARPEVLLSEWSLTPREWGFVLDTNQDLTRKFTQGLFAYYERAREGGGNQWVKEIEPRQSRKAVKAA